MSLGAPRWVIGGRSTSRWQPTIIGGPQAPKGLADNILMAMRSVMDGAQPDAPTTPDTDAVGDPAAVPANAPATAGDDDPTEITRGPFAVDDLSMEQMVRDHADAVYRVALSITRDSMLAEDASQDALIKAWQALPSFRGDAPLRNWILRITHNTAISLLRKRRDEFWDPDDLPERGIGRSVEAEVQDRIAIDRFEVALRTLDTTSRSIVVLREVEGLSYDEICDVLNLSMPTVKTRLLRARRQLATALDGWQP